MAVYFLGGGNMAEAMAAGLLRQHTSTIHIVECRPERRAYFASWDRVQIHERCPKLGEEDVLIVAVKPQQLQSACSDLVLQHTLVVSVAAGVSLASLQQWLPATSRLVRLMPNLPCAVNRGVSGAYAVQLSADDRRRVDDLLSGMSYVHWVAHEDQLHTITAISGSGPGYVFHLMNAMVLSACKLGIDQDEARRLVVATFEGAAVLAKSSPTPLGQLQQHVTSVGGTTAAALAVLEQRQVAQAIMDAMGACAQRSRELAQ